MAFPATTTAPTLDYPGDGGVSYTSAFMVYDPDTLGWHLTPDDPYAPVDEAAIYRQAVIDAIENGTEPAFEPPLPVNIGVLSQDFLNNPRRVTVNFSPNPTTTWPTVPDSIWFRLYDPTGEVLHEEEFPIVDITTDSFSAGPIELNWRGLYNMEFSVTVALTGAQSRTNETLDINYADLPEPGMKLGADTAMWGDGSQPDPDSPLPIVWHSDPTFDLVSDPPTAHLEWQVNHSLLWQKSTDPDAATPYLLYSILRQPDGTLTDTREHTLAFPADEQEMITRDFEIHQGGGLYIAELWQINAYAVESPVLRVPLHIDLPVLGSGGSGGPPKVVGGIIGGVGSKP